MTTAPAEVESWVRQGAAALQAGRSKDARALLERVVATGRSNVQVWMLLALACRQMGDGAAHNRSVDEALRLDAGNIFALIWKGDSLAAARDEQGATSFYERALRLANGLQVPPDLAAELERASAAIKASTDRYGTHLESFLTSHGLAAGHAQSALPGSDRYPVGRQAHFSSAAECLLFPAAAAAAILRTRRIRLDPRA
uniref:tetratricopeptide repeat protein n=1 Tax=Sphingomonas bacterium TaxID=1895847 RepID=UPI00260B4CA2|nr:hypothetical protein [Sphingomonas bacterium]